MSQNPTFVGDAVEFKITPDGFQTIGNTATEALQRDYQTIKIDHHKLKFLRIIGIDLFKLEVQPEVKSLLLRPTEGKIHFDLDLEQLDQEVAELRGKIERIGPASVEVRVGSQSREIPLHP